MKTYLLIVFPMVFFVIVSCQNKTSTTSNDSPKTDNTTVLSDEYIVVGAMIDSLFWKEPIGGMKQAEKELGIKVTLIGPSELNSDDQVSQFKRVLARKPKGIVILPVDASAVQTTINNAIKQKIPVVTVDTDAQESDRLSFLGTNRYNAGTQAADVLMNKLNSKGDIGIITLVGSTSAEASLKGFKDKLKSAAPNIKIVAELNSSNNDKITDDIKALIQNNSDISGIFTNGVTETLDTLTVIKELDKVGKIVIVSQGANTGTLDVLQAVKEGAIFASINQHSFSQFYYAIKMLHDLNLGRNSYAGVSWQKTGINSLPNYVDTGTMVITSSNVAAVYSAIIK